MGHGIHFGSFLVADTALCLRILCISIEQLLAQKGMVVASLVFGYSGVLWRQDRLVSYVGNTDETWLGERCRLILDVKLDLFELWALSG